MIINKMVGMKGFEPSTFCSQSRRATRLHYIPIDCHQRVTSLLATLRLRLMSEVYLNHSCPLLFLTLTMTVLGSLPSRSDLKDPSSSHSSRCDSSVDNTVLFTATSISIVTVLTYDLCSESEMFQVSDPVASLSYLIESSTTLLVSVLLLSSL